MSRDLDHTRRRLLGAGGVALLSGALPLQVALAQSGTPGPNTAGGSSEDATRGPESVSEVTTRLADYVAGTLNRELPANVVARVKLHILDTLAAAVSGSRLKPGEFAARYADSLGGKPQATVIGTRLLTSPVVAAFANGMMAHSDETDDTNPVGPFHPGCGTVPAALATGEVMAGRTGNDLLRAVTLGYDVGVRLLQALGGTRHNPSCMTNTFATTATAAAMLGLDTRQIRHAFSYAGQMASGIGYWDRDVEHIEKAFDFSMGARNGVMATTMVALGATATDDPFSGKISVFSTLGEKPAPELLIADLGTRFEVLNTTIKKWTVGLPLQSVLDNVAALLEDPAVRAGKIKHITIEVATGDIHIVDNNPNPDLCVQHLIALAIADRGATFASVHDKARMQDPKVLAIRKLVQIVPSAAMQEALPAHQTTLTIVTSDGRTLTQHTTLVRGLAKNPMDQKEVEAKALDLVGPVLGPARSKELIGAIANLESFGPVSGLRRLLQA